MTNELKHTPGPWRITANGTGEEGSMLTRPDNGKPYQSYCNVLPVEPGGGIAHIYMGDDWPNDVDSALAEQEANAKLISAAPELLELLMEAERVIRHAVQESSGRVKAEIVGGWRYHADTYRDAIDKATGGTDD